MLNFCSTLGFNVDDSARGTTKADLGYIRISDSGLLAMIGCSSVVNLKCVEKVGLFHLLMTDGTKIRISPSSRETLQQACRPGEGQQVGVIQPCLFMASHRQTRLNHKYNEETPP